MLHTLHVDTGRTWRGGQAQVFGLLASLRGEANLKQSLCAPEDSPLANRAAELGVEVFSPSLSGEWDFLSSRAMRQWIQEREVQIVHAHDAHAHALALRAVRPLRGVKLVVHRRVDFPVRRGVLGRRKYGARVDQWVAISNGVARVLRESGLPNEKITVIPSGIDPRRFDGVERTDALRRELGIAAGAPVIGTVGALVDHKGHRFLIDAMPDVLKSHPEARCVIVGEGELREALERQIADLNLQSHVTLAGWRDDVAACLASVTVFCLPSHLEGLCTSLLDASLFDLPLIACDTGGVPDIVRGGETGWLAPPRDPKALAAALSDALARPEEAKRRAAAARAQTEERFTLQGTAEKTLALWRRLVAEGAV